MRAFVAIDLPEEIRKKLHALEGGMPGRVSLVQEQNLHITLQFLGDINEAALTKVVAAVSAIKENPFKVEIKGISYFGKKEEVRVVFAGIDDGNKTASIYSRLCDSLSSSGVSFKAEKEYTPHVTLGRPKPGPQTELLEFIGKHSGDSFGCFEANSISVKKSTLAPDCPVYETLYESKFS